MSAGKLTALELAAEVARAVALSTGGSWYQLRADGRAEATKAVLSELHERGYWFVRLEETAEGTRREPVPVELPL